MALTGESGDPAGTPTAMTRRLAAMQTSILAAALPLFDRNVDRFVVYVLVLRQSLRGGEAGTPVLSLASSLGMPFETTRRHVRALIAAGLCRRIPTGIVAEAAWQRDDRLHALALRSHDAFVRFVEDMRPFMPLPPRGRGAAAYDWRSGLQAAADLMLAVADTNSGAHRDWLALVLFSTVLHAEDRSAADDRAPALRVAQLARILSLPSTTVQRRIAEMVADGRIENQRGALTVSRAWMASGIARATTAATYVNVRRIVATLEAKGFPFEDVARAYQVGRPADVPLT